MDLAKRRICCTDWSVSVLLPVFNEEATIRQTVLEMDATLSDLARIYEVIVVDDGSRDGTAAIVSALRDDHPGLRLVGHTRRLGYGASLRTGLEVARHPCVAFTDAAGQFDLHDLAWMVPLTDRAPLVVGYRARRQSPWQRRLCSWGFNVLARFLLGTRVRDCGCTLKVFRREALANLLPRSEGFVLNAEILMRARQSGYAVIEVPVRHRARPQSGRQVALVDVLVILAHLLSFWWREVVRGGPPVMTPGSLLLPTTRRAA